MAQKVQIEIEVLNNQAKADFEATAKEVANISDAASETATKVKKSFEQVGAAQREAFASSQLKKAIGENAQSVDKLANELEKLYKEEVRLLMLNKQSTTQYKDNRAESERLRKEFDKLNNTQTKLSQIVIKTSQDVSKFEDELRKLSLEGKQGTKEFDEIAKAIGTYKAAITTADRAVDLYAKTTDAATGRLGELEDKLYDLAIAGKQGTNEFKNTVQEVATLKRAVFEVDQQVDSYVERSRGLTTVVQNVELLGSAFQIAEGASAIFGEENKELQETLVRLNAIMVITQGLERVRTVLLEQSAKKTGIAAVAQRAYTLAVGTTTGAMKLFRLALIGTGIGAFVVALGFVVENFTKIKSAAINLIPGLKEVSEFIGNVIDKTKELLGLNENPENNFLAKLVKSQERALKAQVNNLQRQIDLQDKLGNDTVELEIKKEQIQLDFARKRLKLVEENLTKEQAARLGLNDLIFETQQEILDRENQIAILRIKNEKEFTQEISEEFRKRAAIRLSFEDAVSPEREAEKTLRINETTNEELLNQRARFLQRLEAEGEGGLQNRLNIIRAESQAEIAGIRERLGFTRDANNQIAIIEAETQQRIRDELIANINLGIDATQQSFNAIVDLAKEAADRRIEQIERIAEVERIAIENSRSSEAQKQREREALEVRTTRKVIEERRKLARLEKATGIFNTTIDTAQAIVGFLSDPGGITGIALSVAAGITGATQIAKISSEPLPQFEKGGWVKGKSHRQGGVPIEAEGDEFIVRKSRAKEHSREAVAMNTSRRAYESVIQEIYVRPQIEELLNNLRRESTSVNVNASLNSAQMESELRALRKETKRTGRVITSAMGKSYSSRYNWN